MCETATKYGISCHVSSVACQSEPILRLQVVRLELKKAADIVGIANHACVNATSV